MTTVDTILELKRPRLLWITPDMTVYEALRALAQYDVGGLVVLEGDRFAGMFTERDYARKIALVGKDSRATPVRDVMVADVPCVSPGQTMDECMALMTEQRVRHLPVLEGAGRVVGVISIGDVVKELMSAQRSTIEHLESYIHG